MTPRQRKWQGMNWCRPSTRLAIYLRDGLACVWCGSTIEEGIVFQLDHVKPHIKGGTNDTRNLVTTCRRCNSSRGARSILHFAAAVSEYLNNGVTATDIVKHIRNCTRRTLPRKEALALLESRGSVPNALTRMGESK